MSPSKCIFFVTAILAHAPAWSDRGESGGSVTIYGLLDQGLERVNGRVASADGERVSSYRVNNGTAASRWGIRGVEDLGGGMNASFNLESGFSVDTGGLSQGGRAFGRMSYVSLAGDFGKLGLGRQYTMRYFGILDADLFGAGSQGLGLLDNGIPNARADNSISYLGAWGPISGGLNYSLGRDAVNGNSVSASNCAGELSDSTQCREWSIYAKYSGGSWGVATSYERQNGGTSATYGGLTSADSTDTRFSLSGYLACSGGTNLGIGWIRRDNQGIATPRSNLFWIVGIVPITDYFYFDGLLSELKYEASADKAVLINLRARYLLSKRTSLYFSVAFIDNGGTLALSATSSTPALAPLPGGSQNAIIAGIRHTF